MKLLSISLISLFMYKVAVYAGDYQQHQQQIDAQRRADGFRAAQQHQQDLLAQQQLAAARAQKIKVNLPLNASPNLHGQAYLYIAAELKKSFDDGDMYQVYVIYQAKNALKNNAIL